MSRENQLASWRAWYHRNKEELAKKHAERYKADPQKFIERSKRYIKRRTLRDPLFRLRSNLRTRLRVAIKNNQKMGSAVRDLGCSIVELKVYLESKFTEGMSWSNYGNRKNQWSIDHIIAITKFDLSTRAELLKAVHYTNLQPLWQHDNVRKSNH